MNLFAAHAMFSCQQPVSQLVMNTMIPRRQMVRNVLAWEKPDLAVLSGDMVSGPWWDKTEGWFAKRSVTATLSLCSEHRDHPASTNKC
jgi:hypothetical protein